jgi:hypothetical protein
MLSAGLFLILPALAQNAPSTPPPGGAAPGMQGGAPMGGPGGGQRPPYQPRNLKVLPADTDLEKVMRSYSGALGVQCGYCHAPADPTTHRSDRASDANPMKDQARVMIRMTDDLNKRWLPMLAKMPDDHDEQAVIGCGTCHRGEKHPPAFAPAPRPEGQRPPGAPPAAPATPMPPSGPS